MEHKLSKQQINKAIEWYVSHEEHINRLVKGVLRTYPPTDSEDRNNPALWKAEHWLWFLRVFDNKICVAQSYERVLNAIDDATHPSRLNKIEYLSVLKMLQTEINKRIPRLESEIDSEVDAIGQKH